MKKILLVCSAGMSTSMLVKKMQDTANKEGKEYEVEALALSEAETKVDEVDVIDMQQYGMMDGEGVLKHAESLMK
ncbi:PTS sugar transporter subunit IIB [Mammaliicoccus sciuri]